MPYDVTTSVDIQCDNADCPGHDLDPNERKGWLFMTTEVYGEPTRQWVVCSAGCAAAVAADIAADLPHVEHRE